MPPRWTNIVYLLLVLTFAGALVVLGALQYQWIGDLSTAEEQRMHGALDRGARHVAEDVDREIGRMAGAFRDSAATPDDLSRSLRQWTASARDARLLAGVYLAHGRGVETP